MYFGESAILSESYLDNIINESNLLFNDFEFIYSLNEASGDGWFSKIINFVVEKFQKVIDFLKKIKNIIKEKISNFFSKHKKSKLENVEVVDTAKTKEEAEKKAEEYKEKENKEESRDFVLKGDSYGGDTNINAKTEREKRRQEKSNESKSDNSSTSLAVIKKNAILINPDDKMFCVAYGVCAHYASTFATTARGEAFDKYELLNKDKIGQFVKSYEEYKKYNDEDDEKWYSSVHTIKNLYKEIIMESLQDQFELNYDGFVKQMEWFFEGNPKTNNSKFSFTCSAQGTYKVLKQQGYKSIESYNPEGYLKYIDKEFDYLNKQKSELDKLSKMSLNKDNLINDAKFHSIINDRIKTILEGLKVINYLSGYCAKCISAYYDQNLKVEKWVEDHLMYI